MGGFGGNFQKSRPNFSEVAFMCLVDVSDFFNFFLTGGGKGEVRDGEGGGVFFLLKIPGGGGGFSREGGPRGREGLCGKLEIWGGVS